MKICEKSVLQALAKPTFVRSPIDMIRNKIYVFHFIVAAFICLPPYC